MDWEAWERMFESCQHRYLFALLHARFVRECFGEERCRKIKKLWSWGVVWVVVYQEGTGRRWRWRWRWRWQGHMCAPVPPYAPCLNKVSIVFFGIRRCLFSASMKPQRCREVQMRLAEDVVKGKWSYRAVGDARVQVGGAYFGSVTKSRRPSHAVLIQDMATLPASENLINDAASASDLGISFFFSRPPWPP